MKSFLKYTLATIVGVIVSSLFVILIFVGIVSSVVSSSKDKETEIKENSVLYLKLNKQIVDRAPNNPFANFNFGNMEPDTKLGLWDDILENIEKAKTDDNIKGIYLDISVIPAGIGTIEEIRNALIDFKESKKFIISYSEVYSQKAYYLASIADEIYLNPEGMFDFRGLKSQTMFLKGALEKLAIEPQIIRHGKFKSAVEPLFLDKMSEASKEQTMKYVGSIWNHMVKKISESRDISVEKLNEYANNYQLGVSIDLVDRKLIDGLKYKDEIIDILKLKLELEDKNKVRIVKLKKYTDVPKKKEYKGLAKDKIAIIFAQGSIISGEGSEQNIGSERISRAIRKARKDSTIKAIVFRVNSGGGSALASDVILREIKLATKEKPVIATMGDVAASGGYYVLAAADEVLASPNTITGSIGVFGVIPNMQKLFNKKLGLTFDGIKTNKYADFAELSRPLTLEEKEMFQNYVEKAYDTFITHVSDGRQLAKEEVDRIGQGRVWSGADALELGLIDRFGGLDDAIAIAVKKTGLEKYRIVAYPEQEDPFEQIMKQLSGDVKVRLIESELGENYKYYQRIKEISEMNGIQARMLQNIDIY
jgi:protease IV